MQVVNSQLIKDKKVLLRLDLDVPLKKGDDESLQVADDFRLMAGMETLKLCLSFAQTTIVMGHLGRPQGQEVKELSVEPIYDWLQQHLQTEELGECRLRLLENLRFEKGEEEEDLEYAKELASLGDFYINEAFASDHSAASTTLLPKLLPHAAGLHFVKEVEMLTKVRENPLRPLVVIIGGVKVEDKLPAVLAMSKIADKVLVGGKIVSQLSAVSHQLSDKVVIGELNEAGTDITEETVQKWKSFILEAKMIAWNGPLGKVEDPQNNKSQDIAQLILKSQAESIIGGGDTITALNNWGMLCKFTCLPEGRSFISTGGGAMLKFLSEGTLPTLKALGS